jgi:hypothetical protein
MQSTAAIAPGWFDKLSIPIFIADQGSPRGRRARPNASLE